MTASSTLSYSENPWFLVCFRSRERGINQYLPWCFRPSAVWICSPGDMQHDFLILIIISNQWTPEVSLYALNMVSRFPALSILHVPFCMSGLTTPPEETLMEEKEQVAKPTCSTVLNIFSFSELHLRLENELKLKWTTRRMRDTEPIQKGNNQVAFPRS